MFKKCCSSRSEKNYKIHHSPRPIKLSEEMDTVIIDVMNNNNFFIVLSPFFFIILYFLKKN